VSLIFQSGTGTTSGPRKGDGYDAGNFSTPISSLDGTRRLRHAFFDDPDVNCAPLFVNALDGKNCPIQVLSKTVHRVRQVDARSTHASWVLPCR
jgi:hypothetical protein